MLPRTALSTRPSVSIVLRSHRQGLALIKTLSARQFASPSDHQTRTATTGLLSPLAPAPCRIR
jgi:hypothetical protein